MKRIKQFTSRMLAVMLAGTLAVGSLSVSAFGAEDAGSTAAAAEEFSLEEATENSAAEATATEEVDREVMTESSSAEVVDGEGVSESPDAAFADTSQIAAEEEAVTSYTVTLDANGGYFVNELDDVLNETLEKTEVLNKIIHVGETVSTVPLNDQEGTTATFLGWSLERDGEILPQEQEGYAPVGDCVLYAMWKYDDAADSSVAIGEDVPEELLNDPIETEEPEVSTPEEDVAQENDSEDVLSDETVAEENAEESPASYAVTLDANGGYFVNEWDDVLGEYVEHAEILNKVIPVEGVVSIVPVNEQDGITATFLGWSLERDGEILPQEQEGYAPVGDCVLYAVWDFSEALIPDHDDRQFREKDQTDSTDIIKEDDAAEGSKENENQDNTSLSTDSNLLNSDELQQGTNNSQEEQTSEKASYAEDRQNKNGQQLPVVDESITESVFSSAKNAVMYDSYEGIDYTKLTTNRKRIAALNKAKDMVTVTWVSPATFRTWYAFSSEGPHNSVVPEDGGTSSQYFMQGSKYKGIPYTMYTVDGESPNRNAKDNIDWENIISKNTTSKSLTAKYSGQDVPAYGIDCSSFVWRALQETGEKISYYTTSSMAESGYYKKIEWDDIKPGDILLKSGHVMMYIGRIGDKYAVFEATPPKTQYWTYDKTWFESKKYSPYTFIGYGKVDQIILSDSEMEIYEGDSKTIVATIMPDDATNKDVIWESDNEKIVTVDQTGTITGIAKGVATITATAKDKSEIKASCVIKVKSGKIYSIQDLKDVSDDLSNSYILMNDLNLGNEEWTPIGTSSNPFTGEFNGNGHTITGLKINSDSDYQGLFGMTSGASVSRLKVSGSVHGKGYVAGIAGYASDSTFSYCINSASISGVDQVGGIVGRPARSSLTYCMNSGSISASNRGTGGVAADIYPSGSISNSLNTGSISGGTDLTGGIVGGCTSGAVSSCINAASVTYQKGRAGGIAGDNAYYAGSRSDNFFLQTASINKGFKVIGSGSGTFISSSDSKVVDLRGRILSGFSGKKLDQNIFVKSSAASIAVGKTAMVSITGAKGMRLYKSSNTAIATVTSAGIVTAKKVGTVKITATSAATANYNAASKTVTIKVVPASITKAKVTCPASKVWAGWALTPVPTVKFDSKTLKKGIDFSLSFTNNKNVGTATITITGKGNYTGTIKKTFKINPKPTSISKLTGGSKNFTIGWKKQPSQTSGYQIQYSSRNDFKTQKIVTVSGASKTSRTVSGLAKKHKYYVRIRTYKTVGKTKYYSTWSASKTVTTK